MTKISSLILQRDSPSESKCTHKRSAPCAAVLSGLEGAAALDTVLPAALEAATALGLRGEDRPAVAAAAVAAEPSGAADVADTASTACPIAYDRPNK